MADIQLSNHHELHSVDCLELKERHDRASRALMDAQDQRETVCQRMAQDAQELLRLQQTANNARAEMCRIAGEWHLRELQRRTDA